MDVAGRLLQDVLASLGPTLRDHPSLQERVYCVLRQAIIDGAIPHHSRLIETEIAQALGVSRNPVREAIRRLQQEGLVVVRPRSGVFVPSLSTKDIEDTYAVRSALEGLAASLAAWHVTAQELTALRESVDRLRNAVDADDRSYFRENVDRFHNVIHQASRNERLTDFLARLNDSIKRLRAIASSLPERRHATLRDHEEILHALEERDGTRAEWLMRSHIDGARRRVLAHLTQAGVGEATGNAAPAASLSGGADDHSR